MIWSVTSEVEVKGSANTGSDSHDSRVEDVAGRQQEIVLKPRWWSPFPEALILSSAVRSNTPVPLRSTIYHAPLNLLFCVVQLSRHKLIKMATRVQKIMTQPINLIFRFLQSKTRVLVWLYEQTDMRIEGRIIGFDEYMNLVLDEAEEVSVKRKTRKPLGRILLKGDTITLMQTVGRQQ